MGRGIGFILGKGGVGKTTTTYNVASGFSIMERTNWTYKLGDPIPPPPGEDEEVTDGVIDMDPTRHLTKASGIILYEGDEELEEGEEKREKDLSTHEVLLNPQLGVDHVIRRSPLGYDVIPASRSMDNVEMDLNKPDIVGREYLLNRAMRQAVGWKGYRVTKQAIDRKKRWFADTPRNLGILTVGVMIFADLLFVPLQPEYFADDTLDDLDKRIEQVRVIKPTVKIDGFIITMFDGRTDLHKTVVRELSKRYPDTIVFDTRIRRNIRLAEAPGFHKSIFEYDPSSLGAHDYYTLIHEMKEKFAL